MSNRVMKAAGIFAAFTVTNFPIGYAQVNFVDVSVDAGLKMSDETWGLSVGECNGDGYPDIFVSNHRLPSCLYKNNGDGTFAEIADTITGISAEDADAHGAAWGDTNNDGTQELYVQVGGSRSNNNRHKNQFFTNDGNCNLNEVADDYNATHTEHRGRSALFADVNNDGLLDLVLSGLLPRVGGRSAILTQDVGGASFTDTSEALGFTGNCINSQSKYMSYGDFNNDGTLDIACGLSAFGKHVFDLTTTPFTDIGNIIPSTISWSRDVTVGDFDGDLLSDIVVISSTNNIRDSYLIDNGQYGDQVKIHFEIPKNWSNGGADIQLSEGNTAVEIEFSTSNAPGAYTHANLIQSVYVGASGYHPSDSVIAGPAKPGVTWTWTMDLNDPANHGLKSNRTAEGVYFGYNPATKVLSLYGSDNENIGALLIFAENVISVTNVGFDPANSDRPLAMMLQADGFVKDDLGLGDIECLSITKGDFDNDMDLDLFLGCTDNHVNVKHRLLLNDGNGEFTEMSGGDATGLVLVGTTDSVVTLDFDRDGRLDIADTRGHHPMPISRSQHGLYQNTTTNGNHWFELDLEGTQSNRDGVGARIFVTTPDGTAQLREQNNGAHAFSQDDDVIHFGLGSHTTIDTVEIRWPSGTVDVHTNVAADNLYRATEAGALAIIIPGGGDDPNPQFSILDATVNEDGGEIDVVVTLSPESQSAQTVDYVTADGSAVLGSDYNTTSGTLQFSVQQAQAVISVPIVDDADVEGNETFTVRLSNGSIGILDATATVTISDNDVPPSNLLAHWTLNDATGNLAVDSIGSHHGALENLSTWVAGLIAGALSFDGSDQFVRVPDSNDWNFSGKRVSVAAWFKTDANQNAYARIFDHYGWGNPGSGWRLGFDKQGDNLVFEHRDDGTGNDIFLKSRGWYNDNLWHHVVVTLDGITARLYIDGVLDRTDVYSNLNDRIIDLTIGGKGHNSTKFRGTLDDLCIFGQDLDMTQITTLYNGGAGAECGSL